MSVMEREQLGRDLQAAAAGVGVKQGAIARRLGWSHSKLSLILSGDRAMPEGFAAAYRAALSDEVTSISRQIVADAEAHLAEQLRIADSLLKRAQVQEPQPEFVLTDEECLRA